MGKIKNKIKLKNTPFPGHSLHGLIAYQQLSPSHLADHFKHSGLVIKAETLSILVAQVAVQR